MQAAPGGILAIDTGTRAGWCYGDRGTNGVPGWGVIILAGISDLPASFVGLDNELTDLIDVLQPRKVVYEAPLAYTAEGRDPLVPLLLIGLAAHVQSCCYRAEVMCQPRHVGQVRKQIIGRGNFAKPFAGNGRMRTPKGGGEAVLRGDAKEEVRLWADGIGWGSITEPNARDAAVLLQYELIYGEARITAGAGSVAA